MKRIAAYLLSGALVATISGCFEITRYAVQHSLGARLGPCQSRKDSVEAAHGKPYRRYFSDDENVSEKTQIFWHEWAYPIAKESAAAAAGSDSSVTGADSVRVIGFRWGDGVVGCDVRDRRVRKGDHPSVPWEGAGDVPRS